MQLKRTPICYRCDGIDQRRRSLTHNVSVVLCGSAQVFVNTIGWSCHRRLKTWTQIRHDGSPQGPRHSTRRSTQSYGRRVTRSWLRCAAIERHQLKGDQINDESIATGGCNCFNKAVLGISCCAPSKSRTQPNTPKRTDLQWRTRTHQEMR